ncbi:MAG: GNAT family N-acetyltransferase [Syntrophorhabdaceae bacterium]|nr:GNAT family N-acetyltransferase [Syntrophorhabdaceae bacterium]
MLKIKKINTPDNEKWDTVWSSCDYATYFHSRQWAEIWNEYSYGSIKPAPELVAFTDNKEVLIPFSFQKRKGISKTYYLTADGQFGNWISLDNLEIEHILLLTKYIDRHCKNLVWRLNPYDPASKDIYLENLYELEVDENHAVDLSEGFNSVLSGCYHGHRCSYKKGVKEGLKIRLAEDEKDWKSYYHVYEDTVRRWGDRALSVYDWRLFEIIFKLRSPYIKLWLVQHNDTVIAGALCFYAKTHVVCWHAAALESYLPLRPMNFMFLEVMKTLCDCDYGWFDFNTSAHLDGLKTFKSRFGARQLQCNVYYKKSKTIRTYIKIKDLYKTLQGS